LKSIKIETKLTALLTLVASFSILACMVTTYFVIKPGLRDLFTHIELQKISPWARSLELVYGSDGNWDAVVGKEKSLFPDTKVLGPSSLESRVRLFDKDGKRVLGQSGTLDKQRSLPLSKDGTTIGYLSLDPPAEGYLEERFARTYLESQVKTFGLVGLLILVLSAVLARAFAKHFLRPINSVLEGARTLASGNYQFEMPKTGRLDELGDLSLSFGRLAETLRAAEHSRNEWVADTSHELRTPLAVLRAEIEALQDGIHEPNEQSLAVLHREVMGLTTLVNELNELSKADVGGLAYRFAPVDVGGLVAETAESFRERFSQLDIKVEITVRGTCQVDGDKDRLRQLWANLLENSLRYTDSPGTVKVDVTKQGGRVFITVQDSAPGVPDEALDRLFERFFRADPSRTRGRGGSGIGLALVKKIVLAHRGSIKARHSELGGVRVEVEMPLLGEVKK
jgi:two-component system, OmpR family, sensor histidine kinase BaeS